jgi:ribosomal protein S18 acetylase RimI-like enzyme
MMSDGLVVEEAMAVDDELVAAMAALVPQLSPNAPPPGPEELKAMIGSPATVVLVARRGVPGPIVGTLTLALFRIPTGVQAIIEDVVVDEAARGSGAGAALVEAALARAEAAGARRVDLTSRPDRQAANRLYLRLGFVQRSTNVYRFDLEKSPRRNSEAVGHPAPDIR